MLAPWFAEPISSPLKMKAICSSETSVETQRTTRCHIPEDNTLHNEFLVYLHLHVNRFVTRHVFEASIKSQGIWKKAFNLDLRQKENNQFSRMITVLECLFYVV
jgi:hypothetical protein